MTIITYYDFDDFCRGQVQPKCDVTFVKWITVDPEHYIDVDFDLGQGYERYFPVFDQSFGDIDWSVSFNKSIAVVCDEAIQVSALEIFHQWLMKRCVDITNVWLLTTHHWGISDWWQNHNRLLCRRSFHVRECHITWSYKTWGYVTQEQMSQALIQGYQWHEQRLSQISKYFGYQGGSQQTFANQYVALRLAEYQQWARIDCLARWYHKHDLIGYAEWASCFKDQATIDKISIYYDNLVDAGTLSTRIEPDPDCFEWERRYGQNSNDWAVQDIVASRTRINIFGTVPNMFNKVGSFGRANPIWASQSKHTFALVVRETLFDTPYITFTEKTYSPMAFLQPVIPIGYRAVDHLRSLGFWMIDDIIDFGFQHTPYLHDRITGLVEQLGNMIAKYSMDDLRDYLEYNKHNLLHNVQVINDLYAQRVDSTVVLG